MYKITIIYDSKTGNTEKMARATATGAGEVSDIDVKLNHVEEADPDDLLNSDGIIIGSPTHCGVMSWKIKKFFDENTSTAWGKVDGKIAAAFSSSGGLGGGNEMAAMSMINMLMNYGYLVFGLPEYAAPGVTAHYGAVAIGEPGEKELKSCKLLGQKTAQFVKQMNN